MPTPPVLDHLDALLAPIPGDDPSGQELSLEIKNELDQLRKEIKTVAGEVDREPDWPRIVCLAAGTLTRTSKHCRLAVRLTEALVRQGAGYAGLRDGLSLLRRLVEECWDRLQPVIPYEGGEERTDALEVRFADFHWLDDPERAALFPHTVRRVPLFGEWPLFSVWEVEQASEGKGPVPWGEMARAVRATRPGVIQNALDDLAESLRELEQLAASLRRRAAEVPGVEPPTMSQLREAVQQCHDFLRQLLREYGGDAMPASAPSEMPSECAARVNPATTDPAPSFMPPEDLEELHAQMLEAAADLDFESAAQLRDRISRLKGQPVGRPKGKKRRPRRPEPAAPAMPPASEGAAAPDLPFTPAPRQVPPQAPTPAADLVDCTVFAPPRVPLGQSVLIQVFVHLPEQAAEAKQLAREFDDRAERRGFQSLEAEVERGSCLTIQLILPGLRVAEPARRLTWRGRTTSVQFEAAAPAGLRPGPVIGTALVSQQGEPIGHIKFKLELTPPEAVAAPAAPLGHDARRYELVFISYSSQDRAEVLKRVQMLKRLKVRCFQDVLDLEPGDRWEEELYRHIDRSDLFLLFWSRAAKGSAWVMREVKYALRRQGERAGGLPEVVPVVLEGPPIPAPPPELQHLHFNDQILSFLRS